MVDPQISQLTHPCYQSQVAVPGTQPTSPASKSEETSKVSTTSAFPCIRLQPRCIMHLYAQTDSVGNSKSGFRSGISASQGIPLPQAGRHNPIQVCQVLQHGGAFTITSSLSRQSQIQLRVLRHRPSHHSRNSSYRSSGRHAFSYKVPQPPSTTDGSQGGSANCHDGHISRRENDSPGGLALGLFINPICQSGSAW
jgi:hypothetical protein